VDAASALPAAEAGPARPNVVIFLVDDMGVMDTSVPFLTDEHGNPGKDNRGPFGPPGWNWHGLTKADVTLPRLLEAAGYDLFPTVLGLTGVRLPAGHVLDGSRLDTLLTGKPDKSREEVFLMHYPHSPHPGPTSSG
jgi:hypothetical protein